MKKTDCLTHPIINMWLAMGVWWSGYCLMNLVLSRYSPLVKDEENANNVKSLELWWVELSVLQHIASFGFSVAAAKLLRKSLWPSHVAAGNKKALFVASLGHLMGTLATNAAYTIIKSDVAFFLRACQPLFTILLSLRDFASLQFLKFLSVVAIVIGVSALQWGSNILFTMPGLLVATVSTLGFSVRNIFLYELDGLLEIFVAVSSVSAVLSLPLWCVKVAINGSVLTGNFPVGGLTFLSFIHPIYSFSSLKILKMVTPVTHAIATTCIVLFPGFEILQHVNWSWNLIGIFIVIAGFASYHYGGGRFANKLLFLTLSFLFACLLLGKPSSMHIRNDYWRIGLNTQSEVERVISTAWLYDRPITENIVANIGDLADSNPTMKVNVYCGTTQCVHKVAALKKENVVARFAVMSDIVKGTPLERWVARHPINKLLAGREFENHLHEVAILGILWQYGGYYVNPMVKTTKGGLLECHNSTMAVVSEEAGVHKGSLPSVFNVAYFSSKHHTIKKLIEVYISRYPKVSDPLSFKFSFMSTVWKSVKHKSIHQMYNGCAHISMASHDVIGTKHYGILSHSVSKHFIASHTDRLCDEMENFSGIQYLPFVDYVIERSNLQMFNSSGNVTAFFNGKWGISKGKGLPLNFLNPIMLSVHLESSVRHNWSDHLDYLRAHEPIGCRDTATLHYLQANGVKAFPSSSVMLLMKNPTISKFNIRKNTYLTDVKAENKRLLPFEIQAKEIHLVQDKLSGKALSEAAYQLIEMFGSAKLVITENIQHALLCVALETPVVFINSTQELEGVPDTLGSLVHSINRNSLTEDQVMKWFQRFPWNNPPPNPNPAILMRLRATLWNVIRQNPSLLEAAKKFGTIPMFPPLTLEGVEKCKFFLVFTTKGTIGSSKWNFNWKHWRAVESIFFHHPTANVMVYSNTLSSNLFDVLVEAGYSIQVQRYSLEKMLVGTPAESFIEQLQKARKTPYWYSNESNLLRMLLMYILGGIYMDIDVIIVRPFYALPKNVLAWQSDNKMLNGAVMKFEKGSLFLKACLEEFAKHFNGQKWGANGPQLLNRVYLAANWSNDAIKAVDRKTFYMMHWSKIGNQCFSETKGKTFDANMEALKNVAFAVHTNGKVTGSKGVDSSLKNGTICKHLYTSYCVLCDQIH